MPLVSSTYCQNSVFEAMQHGNALFARKRGLDYYPFGMQQPGRTYADQDYRYGFNGKEMDNEVYGNGNIYDYGFRIYDPRLGRFLSVDPLSKSFPWYTPYQFAGNNSIWAIDLDGLEELIVVRWFDGDRYTGETSFRINNPSLRGKGKQGGNDMQLIELDASKQSAFERNVSSKKVNKVATFIKNEDGTFKGEYSGSLNSRYSHILKQLQDADAKENVSGKYLTDLAPEKVYFEYSKNVIKANLSQETLEKIKRVLDSDENLKINIEGYASPENETGKPDFNIDLSQRRADAVKSFLILNGIPEDRIISSEGRGSTNVFGDTSTDVGRAENRRAVINYTYEKQQ